MCVMVLCNYSKPNNLACLCKRSASLLPKGTYYSVAASQKGRHNVTYRFLTAFMVVIIIINSIYNLHLLYKLSMTYTKIRN